LNLRLSRGSLPGATLNHLTHEHLFNQGRIDTGARDGFTDDHGSKLWGRK
jgi:hypothetical protein